MKYKIDVLIGKYWVPSSLVLTEEEAKRVQAKCEGNGYKARITKIEIINS